MNPIITEHPGQRAIGTDPDLPMVNGSKNGDLAALKNWLRNTIANSTASLKPLRIIMRMQRRLCKRHF